MRASRLVSIMIMLQVRGQMTAEELAAEFEVSVRTVYRDIDALSAVGVPVFADRGPGGGFQLLKEFRTPLTGLVADEAEAVLMAGLPGPAASLGIGPAAQRAAGKVLAALPPRQRADAGRVAARFHIDPLPWYHAEVPVTDLPDLARAVLDERVVEMTYESWKATRRWRVEPLGLVLKGGVWYLVAAAAGAIRVFRASSILSAAVTDDSFDRPAVFDLGAWWAAHTAEFEAGLTTGVATLRLLPEGLRRLAETGAAGARAAAAAGPADADGWALVSLEVEGPEQAALTLLALGPYVEVVEPRELRVRVREMAAVVVARHG